MEVTKPAADGNQMMPSGRSTADEAVISVQGVGKMYLLYDKPQDRLKQALFWRLGKSFGRAFWALRDVSFEVKRGESVGIIGRNGSGKSTLLQIIAGTLQPTTGSVQVNGRVAALLELGSGFNPEYTGRENVYLNGAILGLSREAIDARFDEIAAFADIGEFIEQPVKLYSSGMVMRLAFAVQAHLDAEVLIVDEALSVGDLHFQHKCMRRIKKLVDGGMTLLFVSHSTETVKRFCRRGLWLESGAAKYFGEAGVAAEKYLAFMRMRDAQTAEAPPEPWLDGDSETPPTLDQALPHVTHHVNLSDERVFLRGQWEWLRMGDSMLRARCTSDPQALAGFQFVGDELELTFACDHTPTVAQVWVDDQIHWLNLYYPFAGRPTEPRLEKTHLSLTPGRHTVLLGLAQPEAGDNGALRWLGGHVGRAAQPLEFKRDPHLHATAGDVERYGNGKGRLTAVELLDDLTGLPVTEVAFGQRVRLRLCAERLQPVEPRLSFSFIIRDRNRIDLFGTTTIDQLIRLDPNAKYFVAEFTFDVRLGPGSYSILAAFAECSEDLQYRVPMDQIDIARVFVVPFSPANPVWYLFHEPIVVKAQVLGVEADE